MQLAIRLSILTILVAAVASGCGSTRTVTVTTVRTRTLTVTTTETIVRHTPAPQPVYVAESGGRLLYKPSGIVTGVSGGQIYFDRWIGYGSESASADARFEMNDCVPSCAGGNHTFVHARVVANAIVPCRGVPIYESLYIQRSDDKGALHSGGQIDLVGLCHEGEGRAP